MPHRTTLRAWAALIFLFPATAWAAALITFAVPAGPLRPALVTFALQAHISLSLGAADACGPTRGLAGRHEVEEGLRQVLAGTGCGYRKIDAGAFVIERLAAPPIPARRDPPPVPAEPTRPADASAVIVTATKRPVEIALTPQSLTAVDGRDLDLASGRDTSDLTSRVAGLTVTNMGLGQEKIFVRGLADSPITGQTQAVVGIYLDGSRLTYDAPEPGLRLTDMQRIEVLRGPQGALYGAGSIGGVLKLVTRPPDPGAFSLGVTATGTATLNGGPGGAVDLVLNAPLAPDRLAIRLVAYDETIGGVVDDPGLGLTNTGRAERSGLRLSALWRMAPGWELRADLINQTVSANDSQYAFESLGDWTRALSVREARANEFEAVSMTLNGDLGWAALRVTASRQSHELDGRMDATLGAGVFGGAGPSAYDTTNHISAAEYEGFLTSPDNGTVTWLLGAFVSDYTHDRSATLAGIGGGGPLYTAGRTDHVDEFAIFGEATWAVTPRFRVTLGGRLFRLGVETQALSVRGPTTTDDFTGQTRSQGFAPKAVAEYRATDRILIYAEASEGYRAGGFNAGGRQPAAFPAPGAGSQPYRQFTGDELVSYEIGARIALFDRDLSLRLAVFDVTWRGIQSDRVGADGLPFTANIGDGRNIGFEAEASFRRGPWRVDANMLINDPELVSPDPSYPLEAGSPLPGVADFTANLSVRRDFDILGHPAFANLAVGFVGSSELPFNAQVSPAMGGYTTSEIAAGIELGDWSLLGRLVNIANQSGDTFNYGNPFLLSKVEVSAPQRPISFALQISRRF